MIRMARLTDYGIMLLTSFARHPERGMRSARDLAGESHVPQPTVSKLLKQLARNGLLEAHRGVKGGFTLSRHPRDISVAEVVQALEGPIAFTECTSDPGCCNLESSCSVRSNWKRINLVVLDSLRRITLEEMAHPIALSVAPVERRRIVVKEG